NSTLVPFRITRRGDGVHVTEEIEVKAGLTITADGNGIPYSFTADQDAYVSWTKQNLDARNGMLQSVDRYHDIPSSGAGTLSTNSSRTASRDDDHRRREYDIQVVSGTAACSAEEQVTKSTYDLRGRLAKVEKEDSATGHNVDTSRN